MESAFPEVVSRKRRRSVKALAPGGACGDACGVIRRVFIGILLALAHPSGQAADWPWRGEVGGELQVAALAELGLKWEIAAGADGLVARLRRPGIEIDLTLKTLKSGIWAWGIDHGTVDLAELWPLARAKLPPAAAGWSASGKLELRGAGTLDPAAGAAGARGELRLTLREGWARSDELKVELSGIEGDIAVADLPAALAGVLPPGQEFRIRRIDVAGMALGDARMVFGVAPGLIGRVSAAELRMLGGLVRLKPFQLDSAKPRVTVGAEVQELQLGEAAQLTPWLIQSARGQLRGRVEIGFDLTKGLLQMRDGGLDIVKADNAEFRLAPSPGLLTGNMPATFGFLPAKWTWARGVGIRNPAYAPLKDIEMGRAGLHLEKFLVTFWPDGPGKGRTATIHLKGYPTDRSLVEEVVMDVNFHGPLTEAMGFGLSQQGNLSDFKFTIE